MLKLLDYLANDVTFSLQIVRLNKFSQGLIICSQTSNNFQLDFCGAK